MYLIGVAAITLEEGPFHSLQQGENRRGSVTASSEEVDQIVIDIGSFDFDRVLDEIRDRVERDPPISVFTDVDDEKQILYWRNRSGEESKFNFDSLKRSLRKLKAART